MLARRRRCARARVRCCCCSALRRRRRLRCFSGSMCVCVCVRARSRGVHRTICVSEVSRNCAVRCVAGVTHASCFCARCAVVFSRGSRRVRIVRVSCWRLSVVVLSLTSVSCVVLVCESARAPNSRSARESETKIASSSPAVAQILIERVCSVGRVTSHRDYRSTL